MIRQGQRDTNDRAKQQTEHQTRILNYREKVTLQMLQPKKTASTQKTDTESLSQEPRI